MLANVQTNMRATLLICLLASMASPLCAQQSGSPSAEAIMARVAANQDRSESERTHYVYVQHAHTISRTGKTVRCEETTDYRITPTKDGYSQQLLSVDGRLLRKGRYIHYAELESARDESAKGSNDKQDDGDQQTDARKAAAKEAAKEDEDDSMDRDLVENMRKNLTATKSKDGIGADLFPLTSKTQADYVFRMLGREVRNGRDCFHVSFAPKSKDSDADWKGDAWIDVTAYEPVVVRTTLAHNVPIAVRLLLGTSVPGLGFTIIYAPQGDPAKPDTVWFPVSFGTEFKLHVLFFINREIVLDAHNRDFEKTHVSSTIVDTPNGAVQP